MTSQTAPTGQPDDELDTVLSKFLGYRDSEGNWCMSPSKATKVREAKQAIEAYVARREVMARIEELENLLPIVGIVTEQELRDRIASLNASRGDSGN